MQESLVPAFALENQLAGKEQTLPKLHRFDVHEARGIDHADRDEQEIPEVARAPGGRVPERTRCSKMLAFGDQ